MPFWLPLRVVIAKHLGRTGPKPIALGLVLGPASSSCSFAALSAGRALFGKGAALVPMMAFLFGATNLSPQVAALAWIFSGVAVRAGPGLGLGRSRRSHGPDRSPDVPCEHGRAGTQGRGESRRAAVGDGGSGGGSTAAMEAESEEQRSVAASRRNLPQRMEHGLEGSTDRLPGGWRGGCPGADSVFRAIFPSELPVLLLVVVHALLGPVLALVTVIGSMGNGPLAAVLWENGVLFAGIIAFLYSDFVVIPSLRINTTYYGWRFAAYLGFVFTISAVGAALLMHALFSMLELIPEPKSGRVM